MTNIWKNVNVPSYAEPKLLVTQSPVIIWEADDEFISDSKARVSELWPIGQNMPHFLFLYSPQAKIGYLHFQMIENKIK